MIESFIIIIECYLFCFRTMYKIWNEAKILIDWIKGLKLNKSYFLYIHGCIL